MHPKYKEVFDWLVIQTNRADRVQELHQAISLAAKELHGIRNFKQDMVIHRVQFARPAREVVFPLSHLASPFTSLDHVQGFKFPDSAPKVEYQGNALKIQFAGVESGMYVKYVSIPDITPTNVSWVFQTGMDALKLIAARNFYSTMQNTRAAQDMRNQLGLTTQPDSILFGFLRRANG